MLERVNISLNMNLSITVNIYCVFLGGLTVVFLTRPYIKKNGVQIQGFYVAHHILCNVLQMASLFILQAWIAFWRSGLFIDGRLQ